jgi:hypothetical protein
MPNLCYNRLIVSGKGAIRFNLKFLGLGKSSTAKKDKNRFSLNNIVPMPDDVDSTTEWARKHWGTSRDFYADVIVKIQQKKNFQYKFLTAGSPPYIWLSKASKLFPDVTFMLEYAIPMSSGGGEYHFEEGKAGFECYDDVYQMKKRMIRINRSPKKELIKNV